MTDIAATFKNQWPDRTKRAYETIALHFEANKPNNGSDIAGHWVAIRLSDGGSDGLLYPSKMHAANYQLHEKQCAYICLPPFGQMSIKEIHRFLEFNEQVFDAGHWVAIRLSDGGSDGVLYPSKMHAANYQLHEKQCAYICLPPFGQMSIKAIHRFLDISAQVYDAGGRLEHEGTHIVPGWL